jgi:hypothetical protein
MKLWPLLLLACLAACGDDSSGPGRVADKAFSFDDPVGDTALLADSTDSDAALDVQRVSGAVSSDSLTLTLEFVDPIVRASTIAPNSLIATIAIDADDDSTTGVALDEGSGSDSSFTAPFPAQTGMGAEYYVFIDALSGGDADVTYSLFIDQTLASYPMTYGERSATMQIPLSVFGIPAGARFRVMGTVGNPQRITDIAPDDGNYEVGGSS